MELKQIIHSLIEVHNKLAEISVRGDDAIRMAEAIQRLRTIVFQAQPEDEPGRNTEGVEK